MGTLLYKFVEAKWGLENIVKDRIKVSTINSLNDPFELLSIDVREPNLRKKLKFEKNEFNNKFGIVSFSDSWKNPLMWAHYAQNHGGMVLGYEVSQSDLIPVKYIENRENLSCSKKVIFETLHKKHIRWEHERELRMTPELNSCEGEGGFYFLQTGEGKRLRLKKILLGCRYETQENKEKHKKLQTKNISINTVRPMFGSYEMCIQKNSNLANTI